jgi:hypothetical protein
MVELKIEHPIIEGVSFYDNKFCWDPNKTEGKFAVYEKENSLKLYGLLFTHDFEDIHRIGGYWYDFDMKKIDYKDVPRWCYRVRKQLPFIKDEFEDLFSKNSFLIGGGFLTVNGYKQLVQTFNDKNIDKFPKEMIEKCLIKIYHNSLKIEVSDNFRDPNEMHNKLLEKYKIK